MRLFVAVPLPEDVTTAAARLVPVHPALRPVAPELLHVTVAFLGTVPDERLPTIAAAVAAGADAHASFRIRFDRLGRFPESGPPRIVWLGVGVGRDALVRLATGVRRSLAARGVVFDAKPFQPHVTLARLREKADRDDARAVAALIDRTRPAPLDAIASEVIVYESVLGRGGSRYTPRASVALGEGEGAR